MKIWITGARGMLASHFQRLLKAQDIPWSATTTDISDASAVRDFLNLETFTHIFNCAAYTAVDQAELENQRNFQVNALGPQILAVAAKQQAIKLVHFSTDYVFDGTSKTPYREQDATHPINAYGEAKYRGEQNLLEANPSALIIRSSWLFGIPGKNFVATMLRLMKEKEQIQVVADQWGCPTFCEDLAQATLHLREASGIYHFVNREETSWHKFALEIQQEAQALGLPLKVKNILPIRTGQYPTAAKRPAYSVLSTEKYQEQTQKIPRKWQEALREYLTQYQRITVHA